MLIRQPGYYAYSPDNCSFAGCGWWCCYRWWWVASRGTGGSVLAFSGELWRRRLTSSPPRAREPREKRPYCSKTEKIKAPAWGSCDPPGFLCCSRWCGGLAAGEGVRLSVTRAVAEATMFLPHSLHSQISDWWQIYVVDETESNLTTLSRVCQDRGQDGGRGRATLA